MTLAIQLGLATLMVACIIVLHLLGLTGLLVQFRKHRNRTIDAHLIVQDGFGILAAAFGLFALHAIEIWAYAVMYLWVGVVRTFEAALYFLTATYTTVGYGDLVLKPDWRVLGAIEAANGVILLGWFTAFFVGIVSRLRFLERELEKEL